MRFHRRKAVSNIVLTVIGWLTTRNGKAPTPQESSQAMDFLAQMAAESSHHGDSICTSLAKMPGAAGLTYTTTIEIIACGDRKVALYSAQLADNGGTAPVKLVDRQLLNVVPGS